MPDNPVDDVVLSQTGEQLQLAINRAQTSSQPGHHHSIDEVTNLNSVIALKADAATTTAALAAKADAAATTAALATKANSADVASSLATKADTNDVNAVLALKANTSTVNGQLATKANTDAVSALAADVATKVTQSQLDQAIDSCAPLVHQHSSSQITDASATGRTILQGDAAAGRGALGLGTSATQPIEAFASAGHSHPVSSADQIRQGVGLLPITPQRESEADTMLDQQLIGGPTYAIDPTTGRNKHFVITGNVKFSAAPNVPDCSGVIRMRVAGDFKVEFDPSIRRTLDDMEMAPDARMWAETEFVYFFANGRMRIGIWHVTPVSGLAFPTLTKFGAFFAADLPNMCRVGNSTSAYAAVGDRVNFMHAAGGFWSYVNASGVTTSLASSLRSLFTNSGSSLGPVLSDIAGRRCLKFNSAEPSMRGTLNGFQQFGTPNPVSSPNAMPYENWLSFGCCYFSPEDEALTGSLVGVSRESVSNTAQMAFSLESAGKPYARARMVTNSTAQSDSAASEAALASIHSCEIDDARPGAWRIGLMSINVTSIDAVEDTAAGNASVRGSGAIIHLYSDAGFSGEDHQTISSARGANGLGFSPTLFSLGCRLSSVNPQEQTNAAISRAFVCNGQMAFGSQLFNDTVAWLGGVE